MLKKWLLACGVAGPALASGWACAAELPVKAPPAPPPPPAINWTGCYIGGHLGGAWSRTSSTYDDGRTPAEGFDYDESSWIGGGQVGCQYEFVQSWVIGIEGTWSGLNLDGTDTSAIIPTSTRRFHANQIGTVVGKLGWTWDRWMLYGVGGYAAAKIDMTGIEPAFGATWDNDQWRNGATAGLGLEYMPWNNVVLGVEGDWYRFSDSGSGIDDTGIVNSWSGHTNVFAITGRISYLFNFFGPQSEAVSTRY